MIGNFMKKSWITEQEEADVAKAAEMDPIPGETEEGKSIEEKGEAVELIPQKDDPTILNIAIGNEECASTEGSKPNLEEESQSSVEEPLKNGKGKKKGKTPTPSRPASPEDIPEDFKALAEEQDMRYFVQLFPKQCWRAHCIHHRSSRFGNAS